jgi:hypothetical protein
MSYNVHGPEVVVGVVVEEDLSTFLGLYLLYRQYHMIMKPRMIQYMT